MLLTVDIGNTNIKFGVYDADNLTAKLSVPTMREISATGLTTVLGGRITQPITAAIVSSVVPEVERAVREFIEFTFQVKPILVANNADFGLDVKYEPLGDIGTDRLVNAFSAAEKYGVPVIVCSFGTALTIDYINKYRVLIGGLIAPGMKTIAAALKTTTSRLPEVEIEKPDLVIQNTTVGSLQSGIVYGYFGLVDGLLTRVKTELGDNAQVIATGGFAHLVAENTTQIAAVDENLLLDGLQRLHARITGQ